MKILHLNGRLRKLKWQHSSNIHIWYEKKENTSRLWPNLGPADYEGSVFITSPRQGHRCWASEGHGDLLLKPHESKKVGMKQEDQRRASTCTSPSKDGAQSTMACVTLSRACRVGKTGQHKQHNIKSTTPAASPPEYATHRQLPSDVNINCKF